MVIIKRVLDIGARGVLIPWVNTKEETEYAVSACKYPPENKDKRLKRARSHCKMSDRRTRYPTELLEIE